MSAEQVNYTSHEWYAEGEEALTPVEATMVREQIVQVTHDDENLLPVTNDDIDKWVDAEVTLKGERTAFASVAAAKGPYEHDGEEYVEIGSFYTAPGDRRKGLVLSNAAAVTDRALNRGQIAVGFATEKSLPIFTEDLDYRIVTDENEVPKEMLKECGKMDRCAIAKAAGDLCCDSIVLKAGYEADPPMEADLSEE